jgi:hypothetical protein
MSDTELNAEIAGNKVNLSSAFLMPSEYNSGVTGVRAPATPNHVPVKEATMAAADVTKSCPRCKQYRPVSQFLPVSKPWVCSPCYRAYYFELERSPSRRAQDRKNREKRRSKIRESERLARLSDPDRFRKTQRKSYARNRDSARARQKEYYEKNKDAIRAQQRQYYKDNTKKIRAQKDRWVANNPDRVKRNADAWRKAHSYMWNERAMRRYAGIKTATPKWANLESIKSFYAASASAGMSVDHIVPIKSKLVCGLHVIDNLQMMPFSENVRKSNKWWPDMPVAV